MPLGEGVMNKMLRTASKPFQVSPVREAKHSPSDVRRLIAKQLLVGAAAGGAATGIMTLVMEGTYFLLPRQEQDPLELSKITTRLASLVGIAERTPNRRHVLATLCFHCAYGTLAGTGYMFTMRRIRLPPLICGPLYGTGVWAFSYLGWLPNADVLPPQARYPLGRRIALLVSHLVWGTATALIAHQMAREA